MVREVWERNRRVRMWVFFPSDEGEKNHMGRGGVIPHCPGSGVSGMVWPVKCRRRRRIPPRVTVSLLLREVRAKFKKIMASQAQLAADLQAATAQLKKIFGEIAGVQTEVTALKEKVAALEAVIAAGIEPSEELIAAVAAVKEQAQIVDDQIPDVPAVPPST